MTTYNNAHAATYMGVSPSWLAKLRVHGGGPVFHKLGRRVLYRQADLDAWLAERRRNSTSDHGSAERAA